jgi:hypothetical protein
LSNLYELVEKNYSSKNRRMQGAKEDASSAGVFEQVTSYGL